MKESAALVAHPGFRTGMMALMVPAFLFAMRSLLLLPSEVGLDFFVLRLLFNGFLFIPLETIFPIARSRASSATNGGRTSSTTS